MAIDSDLTGVWVLIPDGGGWTDGGGYPIEVGVEREYGEPPYRFRAFKQNGSRLHLRLIDAEGADVKYRGGALAGMKIERRAYTSDVRRGIYWRREDG